MFDKECSEPCYSCSPIQSLGGISSRYEAKIKYRNHILNLAKSCVNNVDNQNNNKNNLNKFNKNYVDVLKYIYKY